MDISRRSFLRGTLAVAASALIAPAVALPGVPTIYADGDHDDRAGLQALLDGEPFHVEGHVVRADSGFIYGGFFALGGTLFIRRPQIMICNSYFEAMPSFEANPLIAVIAGAKGCVLKDVTLR